MTWTQQSERGSAILTRWGLFAARRGGWPIGRALAIIATAWFLLTSGGARATSRDYLRRVLGRPAGWRDVVRHFDSFATSILDRVMLLSGHAGQFQLDVQGLEPVLQHVQSGRGCILMGAHVGSFEVLRLLAQRAPVPVWALMYRRNAGALTRLLDRLAPDMCARVLEIGETESMIRARECVERGEIVGLLADRSPPGHRQTASPFLGGIASFPSGPFVLASVLGAPVFLFHAVRTGRWRYRVSLAPFAERILLRRDSRDVDLRHYVRRYAAALEEVCLAYPMQWFNFFPFWEAENAESRPAQRAAVHPMVADARPG